MARAKKSKPPSMQSLSDRVGGVESRMGTLEGEMSGVKAEQEKLSIAQVENAKKLDKLLELSKAKSNERTRMLYAFFTCVGAVAGLLTAILGGCS